MAPLLLIGTDEAGYGPLLGPLVVAAAVFESARPRASLGNERLGDSKEVYRSGGRAALARGLAPFLPGPRPLSLSGLLARLSVRGDPRGAYRWYGEVLDPLPALEPPPAAFRRLYLNPVCEREFNEGCGEAGGKGELLFRETIRIVRQALEDHPSLPAEVVCDKHGGRNRYAAHLMAGLSPRSIVAETEGAALSRYRLDVGGRPVTVEFRPRADSGDPLVSLASMAAKYLRELFMEGLNAWFAAEVPGLRPTAGYHTDGLRFLSDIAPALSRLGLPPDLLRRSR